MHSNTYAHKIIDVEKGSLADDAGIKPGDVLTKINDKPIADIFDYYYLSEDDKLNLTIINVSGTENIVNIEKMPDDDIGLVFESALLSGYRSCTNNCIFCFIDQMPPGMRETLYFKDDDTRLSFLQGNYVTLTNISEKDLDRIIEYRLAPINISIHATNPDIRKMMLNNRFAGEIMAKMQKIADASLPMNGQIVLCKGINDGVILEETIKDLLTLSPNLRSISVVPVGLTKYRDKLYELEPFTKEDSIKLVLQIESLQEECMKVAGNRFVYASDEWYIQGGLPIPGEEAYDGYPQLENGVGMMRLFIEEFVDEMEYSADKKVTNREVSIVSGLLAGEIIDKLCKDLIKEHPSVKVKVYPIINEFFGEKVTVSGLVTGGDIIKQLKGKELGDVLLVPINMLRSGEDVFLDDVTVNDIEKELNIKIDIVESDGADLVRKILGV